MDQRRRTSAFEIQRLPITPENLARYAVVPALITMTSQFTVHPVSSGLGGLHLVETPLVSAYVRDQDAQEGERPRQWPSAWPVSNGTLFLGVQDGVVVAGAAAATPPEGFAFVHDAERTAVLVDVRVSPEHRRLGLGNALLAAVEEWARGRNCYRVVIETQNTNVAACRFYAAAGCTLASIERDAYRTLPGEARLVWQLTVGPSPTGELQASPHAGETRPPDDDSGRDDRRAGDGAAPFG